MSLESKEAYNQLCEWQNMRRAQGRAIPQWYDLTMKVVACEARNSYEVYPTEGSLPCYAEGRDALLRAGHAAKNQRKLIVGEEYLRTCPCGISYSTTNRFDEKCGSFRCIPD